MSTIVKPKPRVLVKVHYDSRSVYPYYSATLTLFPMRIVVYSMCPKRVLEKVWERANEEMNKLSFGQHSVLYGDLAIYIAASRKEFREKLIREAEQRDIESRVQISITSNGLVKEVKPKRSFWQWLVND